MHPAKRTRFTDQARVTLPEFRHTAERSARARRCSFPGHPLAGSMESSRSRFPLRHEGCAIERMDTWNVAPTRFSSDGFPGLNLVQAPGPSCSGCRGCRRRTLRPDRRHEREGLPLPRQEVQDAPQRARDRGEHEQRHRRRSREPMDHADDHGPDGLVEVEPSKPPGGLVRASEEIAPQKLFPGAVEPVAGLVRTWLRVFSSPGESDRTADHR